MTVNGKQLIKEEGETWNFLRVIALLLKKTQKKQFTISTENRFSNLCETADELVEMEITDESPNYTCQGCNFRFMTQNILDDHKKNADGQKNKKFDREDQDIDKDRIIKDLKGKLINERKAHTA